MRAKRLRLAAMLGISQITQGAVMVFAPLAFYRMVPGVDDTGPFNAHLMRRDRGDLFREQSG